MTWPNFVRPGCHRIQVTYYKKISTRTQNIINKWVEKPKNPIFRLPNIFKTNLQINQQLLPRSQGWLTVRNTLGIVDNMSLIIVILIVMFFCSFVICLVHQQKDLGGVFDTTLGSKWNSMRYMHLEHNDLHTMLLWSPLEMPKYWEMTINYEIAYKLWAL